jgi:hypothetical protein
MQEMSMKHGAIRALQRLHGTTSQKIELFILFLTYFLFLKGKKKAYEVMLSVCLCVHGSSLSTFVLLDLRS